LLAGTPASEGATAASCQSEGLMMMMSTKKTQTELRFSSLAVMKRPFHTFVIEEPYFGFKR
jgi:hypothetical protein